MFGVDIARCGGSSVVTRDLDCAHILTAADMAMSGPGRIRIDGTNIANVSASSSGAPQLLAMPALVNAHDHGRAVRSSSIGSAGKPLEAWLHYLALFPSVDPYLAALVAFAKSALGGSGTVMMHYTRAQGFTDLPTEIAHVARAAGDVGIRVGFAVSMKDRNPLVYGPTEPILAALPAEARIEIEQKFLRQPLSPDEYMALVDAVADAAAGPMFDVQYGPNAVQWCSEPLLEAVADASQRTGRRIHMHLLETQYQRHWLDHEYPDGVVTYLDSIGFLSPRLTLAHCVWTRPDELELLSERGVTIAVNHSSNLHLHSGVPPVGMMIEKGCRVALGIDATALDEDDDALREMRIARLLQAGIGFDSKVSREQILRMAFGNGRLSVTNRDDGGALKPGSPADILLLDWSAIDTDRLRDNIDVIELLLARATAGHIDELIVAGRSVVKQGKIAGVDFPAAQQEIVAQMRAGMKSNGAFAAALSALDGAMAGHYHTNAPCC